MGYLTDADYDDLPEDNGAAFSKLEVISRSRLYGEINGDRRVLPFEDMLRYMNEVTAIAKEFGFSDIDYTDQPDHYEQEFARFTRLVDARLAQIRIQRARRDVKHSVIFSENSRQIIQHHIEKLKNRN